MYIKKPVFEGAATALVTPFKNGKVDYYAFDSLIDFQLSESIDALVICGTTAESSVLTKSEREKLISRAVKRVNGKIPIIAGTGSNSTKVAKSLSQKAQDCGADALLIVTPYYNLGTEKGIIAHYTEIADSVNIPIILYNVPKRTGVNLAPSVCKQLCAHEKICGIKEASGNIAQVAKIANMCKNDLTIYSGNDDTALATLALGGMGIISVISNILPKEMHNLCNFFFEGKIKEAQDLQIKLMPLIEYLFCETNPVPVKAALEIMGKCKSEVRTPLSPLDKEKYAKLKILLKSAGI